MHCGCFCKEMWRMYCSDTRVGERKLAGPIRRSIPAIQTSGSQHSFYWLDLNLSKNVYSTNVRLSGPSF